MHNIAGNCTVSSNFVPSVSGMPQFPPPSFEPIIVMMISMIMMFLVKRSSSIFIKTDEVIPRVPRKILRLEYLCQYVEDKD